MSSSIWHSANELPAHDPYSVDLLYLVLANDEFMSTAYFSPYSKKVSPFSWSDAAGFRRWFAWGEGNFTRWAYVSDILNIE